MGNMVRTELMTFFSFTFNYSCICIYYGKEFACGGYSVDIDLMDSYIGVEIGVGQ